MILLILTALGGIGIIGGCFLLGLWIYAERKTQQERFQPYAPPVSIIIPCKGIDHGFKENVEAFLSQEYSTYRLVFVVDSEDDPAYDVVTHPVWNNPEVTVVLTKLISGCSGKIAALLTGLEHTEDATVLVFADSDIQPDRYWLQNLVLPLQDESIGVSTGYRWYFSTNWRTLLISAWNLAPIVFMFYPNYTFAWGGSTAIRKTLFDALAIKEKWKTAFSDDLVVTTTIKEAGYTIHLQPKCIMESPPETSIKKFLRWGTRQYTWIRWFYPLFWLGSFLGFIGIQLAIFLGILLLLFGYYLPGSMLSSLLLFEILFGWVGIRTMQHTMVYSEERYGSRLGYALITPLVFLFIAVNVFASLFTREIMWAGRTYRKTHD